MEFCRGGIVGLGREMLPWRENISMSVDDKRGRSRCSCPASAVLQRRRSVWLATRAQEKEFGGILSMLQRQIGLWEKQASLVVTLMAA